MPNGENMVGNFSESDIRQMIRDHVPKKVSWRDVQSKHNCSPYAYNVVQQFLSESPRDLVVSRLVRCSQMQEVRCRAALLDDLTLEAAEAVSDHHAQTGEWLGGGYNLSLHPKIRELSIVRQLSNLVPTQSVREALSNASRMARYPSKPIVNTIQTYFWTKKRDGLSQRISETGLPVPNIPFQFEVVGDLPSNAVLKKFAFVFDSDYVELADDEAIVEFTILEFAEEASSAPVVESTAVSTGDDGSEAQPAPIVGVVGELQLYRNMSVAVFVESGYTLLENPTISDEVKNQVRDAVQAVLEDVPELNLASQTR